MPEPLIHVIIYTEVGDGVDSKALVILVVSAKLCKYLFKWIANAYYTFPQTVGKPCS